jgi:catechol 2,3-dioxygenase-like lactoylglutathione lyase family enzyme
MIGYVTLGTNDVDRARAFYDALLAELGAKRLMQLPDNDFTLYGTSFGRPGLAVIRPYDGGPAVPGNGNMAALAVDARDKVDALYAKAIELGAADEGGPGLRSPEGPMAFYGAYFRDPDGNKLCVFRVGPA